ncbi:nucleotide sugar dehydrogenase [Paenibacillus chibensis]|uniref:Nucleotide sugar dehydrogenase n=1 Tax=Paenibacillus chibensis TaxID=59846 RepID=A0ABU6PV03_9BACL|nr:nucleotide sugar dehydrogenase [Paenibacillus chibensis]
MSPTMMEDIVNRRTAVAVIGLGYVGLPIAVAFAKRVRVIGFDVNTGKISKYQKGMDVTGEIGDEAVRSSGVEFTSEAERLEEARFFIVAVPTPVQSGNVPDLQYVEGASRIVGKRLSRGSYIVFESTVYPGVTEDICIPILEAESGLRCGEDFKVGYSPERINPGDPVHRIDNIVKIVSGIDDEALEVIAGVYGLVIDAGVHRASSIKVAEAAKVIENAQRDINIAFMNELSMLFHQMGIDTKDVLEAAGTKWNFLHFSPGLVGGHCIGIDPYYLTYKAEDTGYRSRIILAGRHINDGMGSYIAQQIIKALVKQKIDLNHARIGLLGLAYKENCPDIRNTKVTDIISELQEYGIQPIIADSQVDPEEAYAEYGLRLSELSDMKDLNLLIVAVPHDEYARMSFSDIDRMFGKEQPKVLVDIKGAYSKAEFENEGYYYWRL